MKFREKLTEKWLLLILHVKGLLLRVWISFEVGYPSIYLITVLIVLIREKYPFHSPHWFGDDGGGGETMLRITFYKRMKFSS